MLLVLVQFCYAFLWGLEKKYAYVHTPLIDDCFPKVFYLLVLKIERDECIVDISTLRMYCSTLIQSLVTLFIHLSVCCLCICNGFRSARVLAWTGNSNTPQLMNVEIA